MSAESRRARRQATIYPVLLGLLLVGSCFIPNGVTP